MRILRKPPYPISLSYGSLQPNTDYTLVIREFDKSNILVDEELESDGNGTLTYELPLGFAQYDENYSVVVLSEDEVVIEDNLEIMRPYVDPTTLGQTATEIAEYTKIELIARSIIDSVVGQGFYFKTRWYQSAGSGTDFMPVWGRTYSVLKAYENNLLSWDYETPNDWPLVYAISADKSAITKVIGGQDVEYSRKTKKPSNLPWAASDSFNVYDTNDSANLFTYPKPVMFPTQSHYTFLLETGYKVVPYDIQEAALMLIDDIKCGRIEYYKRYVTSYDADQFKIEYDPRSFLGTGNILVDKILSKYVESISSPGVL